MSAAAHSPQFLSIDTVLLLHELSIKQYGGDEGVRDPGLLDSALAQPKATFSSRYLHQFPFEMAAAYGFHLARNHPFFDGNKRTAWLAVQLFLESNGYELAVPKAKAVERMLSVASGTIDKTAFAKWIGETSRSKT